MGGGQHFKNRHLNVGRGTTAAATAETAQAGHELEGFHLLVDPGVQTIDLVQERAHTRHLSLTAAKGSPIDRSKPNKRSTIHILILF